MELGESITQCCLREVLEETGIKAEPERLVGIYSSPKCVFEWKDGNNSKVWQSFVVVFLLRTENKKIVLNQESVEYRWFEKNEAINLKTLPYVKKIILQAIDKNTSYFD